MKPELKQAIKTVVAIAESHAQQKVVAAETALFEWRRTVCEVLICATNWKVSLGDDDAVLMRLLRQAVEDKKPQRVLPQTVLKIVPRKHLPDCGYYYAMDGDRMIFPDTLFKVGLEQHQWEEKDGGMFADIRVADSERFFRAGDVEVAWVLTKGAVE